MASWLLQRYLKGLFGLVFYQFFKDFFQLSGFLACQFDFFNFFERIILEIVEKFFVFFC